MMAYTHSLARLPNHRGFSLIEVLVALLVLSIGLLGLAALQTTSLQYNSESYFRTQATFLAYDIIDRMRANNTAVVDGGTYDVANSTAVSTLLTNYESCKASNCDCDTSNCTNNYLATYDLGKWYKERVFTTLPNASANPPTIEIDANRRATITMRWVERDLERLQTWVVQL